MEPGGNLLKCLTSYFIERHIFIYSDLPAKISSWLRKILLLRAVIQVSMMFR